MNASVDKFLLEQKKNLIFKYMLIGSELSETETEREFGIVVKSTMRISTQCAAAVQKARSMPIII